MYSYKTREMSTNEGSSRSFPVQMIVKVCRLEGEHI